MNHFAQRLEVLEGKAMIACMSRRICVELYKAIVAIRPDCHHEDDSKGMIKIVMTGFDALCLQTMYVDKPMHGHGLVQAIPRVNRVFNDTPGGPKAQLSVFRRRRNTF